MVFNQRPLDDYYNYAKQVTELDFCAPMWFSYNTCIGNVWDEVKAAARRHTERGKFAAITAFEAYRARFPNGDLRRETNLSLLEALVKGGRKVKAERLAGRVVAGGGLGARRADVLRVRGEMQATLGRCDDAVITLASALNAGAVGLSVSKIEAAIAHCRTIEEAP